MDLTKYLEDIERRMDEDQETALYEAWRDFAMGKEKDGPFQPPARKPAPSNLEWKHVGVNDALQDEDLMVLSQLERCHLALSSPSRTLMMMRANYGVGNVALLFGAQPFVMPCEMDTLPNVYPVGAQGVQRILDAPEPDVRSGHGAKIGRIAERFAEIRRRWPKIGRFVRFENPDAQGPMDNCELLWGSDLFYALYEQPEQVHALLSRVSETICRLTAQWQSILPAGDGMTSYFGQMARGSIVLRDDSAMNLSPEFFQTFIAPYDGRILERMRGGVVHFCGRGDHFAPMLAKLPHLTAVDMSQPHLNDMQKILSALPDQGVNLFCPAGDYSMSGHVCGRVYCY